MHHFLDAILFPRLTNIVNDSILIDFRLKKIVNECWEEDLIWKISILDMFDMKSKMFCKFYTIHITKTITR